MIITKISVLIGLLAFIGNAQRRGGKSPRTPSPTPMPTETCDCYGVTLIRTPTARGLQCYTYYTDFCDDGVNSVILGDGNADFKCGVDDVLTDAFVAANTPYGVTISSTYTDGKVRGLKISGLMSNQTFRLCFDPNQVTGGVMIGGYIGYETDSGDEYGCKQSNNLPDLCGGGNPFTPPSSARSLLLGIWSLKWGWAGGVWGYWWCNVWSTWWSWGGHTCSGQYYNGHNSNDGDNNNNNNNNNYGGYDSDSHDRGHKSKKKKGNSLVVETHVHDDDKNNNNYNDVNNGNKWLGYDTEGDMVLNMVWVALIAAVISMAVVGIVYQFCIKSETNLKRKLYAGVSSEDEV